MAEPSEAVRIILHQRCRVRVVVRCRMSGAITQQRLHRTAFRFRGLVRRLQEAGYLIQIGSDEGGQPIWMQAPLELESSYHDVLS